MRAEEATISLDHDVSREPEARSGSRPVTNQENSPLVLVVDNEPLVRQYIASVISRLGWRTLEAEEGAQALRVGADAAIDLLITDYEMPGMNGIEVADAYRNRLPDLPVLVVSAHETVGRLATSRGCQFLSKPFGPDDLVSLVKRLHVERSVGQVVERPGLAPEPVPRPEDRRRPGSVETSERPRTLSAWRPRPTLTDEAPRQTGDRTFTLRCFPADDTQFAADASRILAECKRNSTSAGMLEQVRVRLAERYPHAVVHPRSLLASNGDPDECWYCYRDGSLVLPSADG